MDSKARQYFIFLGLLALNIIGIKAQHTGQVLDAATKDPLPFVNITFNDQNTLGTTTDINGHFEWKDEREVQKLTMTYIGYEALTIEIGEADKINGIYTFHLKSSSISLSEIVVNPTENPADVLIRKVVANREKNDPKNLESYAYEAYNKTTYDLMPKADSLIDLSGKKRRDSIKSVKFLNRAKRINNDRHLLVLESVSQKKFLNPDKTQETVIANKVSGLNDPSFAPVPANYQPFSFYSDFIRIIDREYVNPVSKGSTRKYFFLLQDTLVTEKLDSIFIISFRPKRGKNFNGLEGLVYVNDNGYALQNIICQPYDKGFIYAKLQQKSELIDGVQWFPSQINFEVIFENTSRKEVGMKITGKSYIRNVELNPEIREEIFQIESKGIDDLANKKDDVFWQANREDTLSMREIRTYEVMDSIGDKYRLDELLLIAQKINQGYLPLGIFDFELMRFLRYNSFEGVRPGVGLRTNEKFSQWFSVGGFLGYGWVDKKLKYGGNVELLFDADKEISLRLEYQKETRQAGLTHLLYPSTILDLKNYVFANLDDTREWKAKLGFRFLRFAKFDLSLSNVVKRPKYDYDYSNEALQFNQLNEFTFTDIKLNLRYAHKEKFIRSFGRRVSLGTNYPIVYLAFTKGIKNFLGGDFDYNRVELGVEKSFKIRGLGKSRIRIDGGIIGGDLPYPNLILSEGNYGFSVPIFVHNTFQTMRPFEFLSDKYLNVFFSHDFGTLLFKTKKVKPEVKFTQYMAFGSLSTEVQHDISYKTLEKGFFESGVILDNLLRFNFFNVAYLGFGTGIFVRYGVHRLPRWHQNLGYKMAMSFHLN